MSEPIIFWYKNWRGEERYRHATPISLRFGTSEWHKTEQWLMLARDEETGENREFALADMRHTVGSPTLSFLPAPPVEAKSEVVDGYTQYTGYRP